MLLLKQSQSLGIIVGLKTKFYTFDLESFKYSNLYIGWTDNIQKRLEKHNSGMVSSTRSRTPFKLIYYEACLDKDMAIAREKQLKTGYGRAYLKRRLH